MNCINCGKPLLFKNIDKCRKCLGNRCVYKDCLESNTGVYIFCEAHGVKYREYKGFDGFEEWASNQPILEK